LYGVIGITAVYGSNIRIMNSTFSNNSYAGLYLRYVDNSSIIGNNGSGNVMYGILLYNVENNEVLNNSCRWNEYYGIQINYGQFNAVHGNTCEKNKYGIYLTNSVNNTITGNDFLDNQYGIYRGGNSDDNDFRFNSIVGNSLYGVYSPYGPLNATYCYWGDDSGPYHPDENPNGTANNVTNKVTFKPWHYLPTCDILSVNPSIAREDEIVIFRGQGNATGDITYFIWSSDMDGEFYRGSEPEITHDGFSNGTHTITLQVMDDMGFMSNPQSTLLTVNGIPVAHIDTITPSPTHPSTPVRFTATGTDDGTIVIYTWSSSIDGEFYNGTQTEFTHPGFSIGIHTITLKVQDNIGAWSLPITQELIIHTKPTASIDSITPSPAPRSTTVRFIGSGTDDGSITRYSWSSSLDGEFYNGTDSEFDNSSLRLGAHTITLKVEDDLGAWSEEVTTTLEITENEGGSGGGGGDDEFFLFEKIGPLPIIAIIVIICIVAAGGAGATMRKKNSQVWETPPSTNSAPQHEPLTETQPPTHWTCPTCNKPVESQYAFCLQCGTKRQ